MAKMLQFLMASAVIVASTLPATAAPTSPTNHNNNTNKLQLTQGTLVSQSKSVRICTRDSGEEGYLNMRSGPGTQYRSVYQIPNGAVVGVFNVTDRPVYGHFWYEVAFRNQVGWVRGDFVCDY
ncbi:MAG: SH3 domain-containing protein [Calothrix sp. MO_167.B12]|nr:SH3 domain-containing protein [Calothrix sp. MO_167.B12]